MSPARSGTTRPEESEAMVEVARRGWAQVAFHWGPASFHLAVPAGSPGVNEIVVDGHNCAGPYGVWTVKIDVNPGGSTTTGFKVSKENPTGTLSWSIPVPDGIHSGHIPVTVSGDRLVLGEGVQVGTPIGGPAAKDGGSVPIARRPLKACD